MFWEISCSSPLGQIVLIQHLVSSLSVSGSPVYRLTKNWSDLTSSFSACAPDGHLNSQEGREIFFFPTNPRRPWRPSTFTFVWDCVWYIVAPQPVTIVIYFELNYSAFEPGIGKLCWPIHALIIFLSLMLVYLCPVIPFNSRHLKRNLPAPW
jgi:hypothetical protein